MPGTVTELIGRLLTRCTQEVDARNIVLLAKCLGETGAIAEHRLGEIKMSTAAGDEGVDSESSSYRWRLLQSPWQSREAKYELQLVTKHLVSALRAAPSSAEQHKIAFTIQQLLEILDKKAFQKTESTAETKFGKGKKKEMSKWLTDKLCEAGVYEVVEPFWLSEFSEKVSRSFFLVGFNPNDSSGRNSISNQSMKAR